MVMDRSIIFPKYSEDMYVCTCGIEVFKYMDSNSFIHYRKFDENHVLAFADFKSTSKSALQIYYTKDADHVYKSIFDTYSHFQFNLNTDFCLKIFNRKNIEYEKIINMFEILK
jgi:hypothetical protein